MSANLSPVFGAGTQLFTNQGVVLAGGRIYTYLAGSLTPQATWTDSTQITSNGTSILLDSYGRVPVEIWLASGVSYKFVVLDSEGGTVGYTYDNIVGVNDFTAPSNSQWVATGLSPSFISSTQMSFSGDQRAVFPVGTRIKSTITAGTAYSTVSVVSFASSTTTVTVLNDSTVLDSGLSDVSTGLLTVTGPSVGSMAVSWTDSIDYTASKVIGAPVQAARKTTTTTGSGSAYVLTPAPATVSLATTNQWLVKFHAAGSGTPTLNISGLGAKSLKQYSSSGAKLLHLPINGQVASVMYDGTDFVISNPTSEFSNSHSLATPGYALLPGGLIMEWGITAHIGDVTAGAHTTTVTFSHLPTGILGFFPVVRDDNDTASIACSYSALTRTGCTLAYAEVLSVTQDIYISWMAIGY